MGSITIDRNGFLANVFLARKGPCRAATTAAITLSGEQTIDGVAVVAEDRVLVKSQSSSIDNGIYICKTSEWERADDFDRRGHADRGTTVLITDGTVNALTEWYVTTTGDPVPGQEAIAFAQLNDASNIDFLQAGTGAVTRSVQAELRDNVITPEQFGATGDGVADDTAELQAMANYACTVGGNVRFKRDADYKITSEVLWRPQANEGFTTFPTPASDIVFNLDKHPVHIDMNGATVTAGAAMTNMFRFVRNATVNEEAPFLSSIDNGRFEGASLATRAVHSEWCLGFSAHRNRIDGVTTGIKCEGYGTHEMTRNFIRATVCFDLLEGGADSFYGHNDLYPTEAAFKIGNAGTAVPGQLRIFSNGATNEAQGTCYFVQIIANTDSDIVRDVSITHNGIAGFDAVLYARGQSGGALNIRTIDVSHNNALDFSSKTTLALVDAEEIVDSNISHNDLSPVFVTSTLEAIRLASGGRNRIIGNNIEACGRTAVVLSAQNRCIVTGNIFHNIGDNVTHAKMVRLISTSSRNIVSDNAFDNDTASFATQGVVEENTADNNLARDNQFLNVATPYTKLGASSYLGNEWPNGTFATIDINGGTVDGATIGGASAAAGTFTSGTFTQVSINSAAASFSGSTFSADAFGSSFFMQKSRNASIGAHTIVQSGDIIGSIFFLGSNGTSFDFAAKIDGIVDGTPGASGDMPGRLSFSTSADGSASPTEKLRIGAAGNFTSPVANFPDFADDAAAAAGGVLVGGWYRTTSTLKIRVA